MIYELEPFDLDPSYKDQLKYLPLSIHNYYQILLEQIATKNFTNITKITNFISKNPFYFNCFIDNTIIIPFLEFLQNFDNSAFVIEQKTDVFIMIIIILRNNINLNFDPQLLFDFCIHMLTNLSLEEYHYHLIFNIILLLIDRYEYDSLFEKYNFKELIMGIMEIENCNIMRSILSFSSLLLNRMSEFIEDEDFILHLLPTFNKFKECQQFRKEFYLLLTKLQWTQCLIIPEIQQDLFSDVYSDDIEITTNTAKILSDNLTESIMEEFMIEFNYASIVHCSYDLWKLLYKIFKSKFESRNEALVCMDIFYNASFNDKIDIMYNMSKFIKLLNEEQKEIIIFREDFWDLLVDMSEIDDNMDNDIFQIILHLFDIKHEVVEEIKKYEEIWNMIIILVKYVMDEDDTNYEILYQLLELSHVDFD